MNLDEDIEITLEKISEATDLCHYNRRAMRHYRGGGIKVGLSARLIPVAERNRLSLLLSVLFTDVEAEARPVLLQESCLAEFSVTDMSRHVDLSDVSLRVPSHLLTLMLSITLGALRGMVAMRTAGTILADTPLPVMDLTQLAALIHNPAPAFQ